jgi:hypothetical protein
MITREGTKQIKRIRRKGRKEGTSWRGSETEKKIRMKRQTN